MKNLGKLACEKAAKNFSLEVLFDLLNQPLLISLQREIGTEDEPRTQIIEAFIREESE